MLERLMMVPFVPGGRDLAGADCWGLVRLFLQQALQIDLPRYDGSPDDVTPDVTTEVDGWPVVPMAAAAVGDVIWMRIAGRPSHVGVIVRTRYMLHTLPGSGPSCERFDVAPWVPGRIISIHRPIPIHRPIGALDG